VASLSSIQSGFHGESTMLRPSAIKADTAGREEEAFAGALPPPVTRRVVHSNESSWIQIVRFLLELFLVVALVSILRQNDELHAQVVAVSHDNARLAARIAECQGAQAANSKGAAEESARAVTITSNGEWETRYRELSESSKQVQTRIEGLEEQARKRNKAMERMQKYLSDTMKDWCQREFPDGPAHVLIDTTQGELEIEMAPCDLMPVVTMHFIQQVRDGYWDRTSFFRAESHVIQASNMAPDGSRSSKPSVMKRSASIPFQEYNEKFPHNRYTLGIAGRPGGPDFYVNMLENVKIHGPGGQGHNYQGDPDSDSCFARVVRGEEVAVKIQALPFKRESGLHILQEPVEIRSMRVIAGEP
jgi:cyclophilin family peptidyl-prolyl cis-trans isomerase